LIKQARKDKVPGQVAEWVAAQIMAGILKKQKTLLLTNKMTIHLKIYQEEVLALA
jgi:DNA-binding transcriptional regulator YhcF (GntR family)